MIQLRRGDSRTLTISDLVDGAGGESTFQAGDALRFTVRTDRDEVVITKTSDEDGGITYGIGTDSGTVAILPADWTSVSLRSARRRGSCDLELTRAGDVFTLFTDDVVILDDVSR